MLAALLGGGAVALPQVAHARSRTDSATSAAAPAKGKKAARPFGSVRARAADSAAAKAPRGMAKAEAARTAAKTAAEVPAPVTDRAARPITRSTAGARARTAGRVARQAADAAPIARGVLARERDALLAAPAGPLPQPVMLALARAHVPVSSVSAFVERVGDGTPLLSVNATETMAPASTMKLITTYAGLAMLGPEFRWRTTAFTDGQVVNGVLNGNLYIEGTGDPKLTPEELIDLVNRIHAAGIRAINGDLVLDKRYFAMSTRDAAPFDSEVDAPYNVGPDPLLYAFKSLTFTVAPAPDGRATIDVQPALAQLRISNELRVTRGACKSSNAALPHLETAADGSLDAVFAGSLSSRCGERATNIAVLDHTAFFGGGFLALWQQTGGSFSGHVREAPIPQSARVVATHYGPVLADVVRDINKFSNNTMARNLYLTIGAVGGKPPADYPESAAVISRWLARTNLPMPGLSLDNGSGLSRTGRVTALGLGELLQSAMASPVAQAFTESLPIVGVDGTMRHRLTGSPVLGNARIKTGTLADVRAIAGYVAAANGQTYVIVSLINDPRAEAARAAHDALLQWVYDLNGPPLASLH